MGNDATTHEWKDSQEAYGTSLLRRRTRKGPEGSNPSLSEHRELTEWLMELVLKTSAGQPTQSSNP